MKISLFRWDEEVKEMWTLAGTYNDEDVYFNPKTKEIAIEKDHKHLTDPTQAELEGIYKVLSHLKPEVQS